MLVCGLAGVMSRTPSDLAPATLEAMASRLRHRGPDDHGIWADASGGIALCHTRLAIVDLSPAGHQPMASASGRFVLAFNGEIYNHRELRTFIEAARGPVQWRGHSDTEVLLACIDVFGLEATLDRAVGMFAVALWDRERGDLSLARDRLGEKPLYWGWQDGAFVFASELSAIAAHPRCRREIDPDSVTLLFRHNYIPAPYSIYRGIQKLPPGTILRVSLAHDEPALSSYWSAEEVIRRGQSDPLLGGRTAIADELERLLRASLADQLLADVPVGVFLSGGIDSSSVAAVAQAVSDRPIRTFAVGFEDPAYDEAEHAAAIARHLGTDHTEVTLTASAALGVVPRLATMFAEPFSDSSQIPTFLVAEAARRSVTVALTGDGGDELFGGYARYPATAAYWQSLNRLPASWRHALAGVLRAAPEPALDATAFLLRRLTRFGGRGLQGHHLRDRLSRALDQREFGSVYRDLVSHWREPQRLVPGAIEPETRLTDPWLASLPDVLRRMMATDLVSYLPDDILCKVDRTGMAVSLETRVPLLDHRIVEFSCRLPSSALRNGPLLKQPLRDVLERFVPRTLFDRPKMGFGVPINAWLRGPLRDWTEELLSERRLAASGLLDPVPIRAAWSEHLAGTRECGYLLWDVLCFQAWCAEHGHGSRV